MPCSSSQSGLFEANLRGRVLRVARTQESALTPAARAFIAGHVGAWVHRTAPMNDASVKAVAAELCERFPDAISGTTAESPVRMRTQAELREQLTTAQPLRARKLGSVGRATTAQPGVRPRGSGVAAAAALNASQDAMSVTQGGTLMAPPVGHGLPAPKGKWTRPQVLARMQRVGADKEWLAGIDQECREVEVEEEQRRDKRRAVREQMRRDMADAERHRELKQQADREERAKLREMVVRTMEEVKADEKAKKDQLRAKKVEEIRVIERQAEVRKAADEKARLDMERENAEYLRGIQDAYAKEQQDNKEHAHEMRSTMVRYLQESNAILEARRAAQYQERMQLADKTAREAAIQDRQYKERRARAEERRLGRVKKQESLQAVTYKVFDGLRAEGDQRKEAEEAKVTVAIQGSVEAMREREAQDKLKTRTMRTTLLRSLEEQLHSNSERRARAEGEKHIYRRQADERAAADVAKMAAEKTHAKEAQLQLRGALSKQVGRRMETLMGPMQIKITSSPAPRW